MTEPKPNAEPSHDTAAAPRTEAGAPEAAQEGAPERDVHSVIEALAAENAQMKDKVLRTLAEMENLRRRTEKEVADARTYATTNFARDMLSAADNMRRALETLGEEARAAAEGVFKGLIEGIELTERDLLKAMAARVHSSEARVRQWMTSDPITATADTDVEEAARVMLEHGFRHLPVVDDDDRVIGIVSLRRVVSAAQTPA